MRILYFGSGEFGLPTLDRLAREHDIAAVVTQPDRPSGRGGRLTPTPVAAWAAAHAVETHKHEDVNVPEMVRLLRAIPVDVFVVIAFGQKLGRSLLEDRFAINLHASLLPRWRGAAPIHAALLAGDSELGNSVITLADRMDAGLILAQSRREMQPLLTAGEHHDLLALDGAELVAEALARHVRGTPEGTPQDPAAVTRAPKLSRADGWMDFSAPADACRRRIHGLTPWPGVTVRFRGEPMKLLRVIPEPSRAGLHRPGTLIDPAAGLVACGDGALRVLEVQPAGKKAMAWSAWSMGVRPPLRTGEALEGGRAAC